MSIIAITSDVDVPNWPAEAAAGFEEMPMIMSPKALAEVLDVTTKTLERWRDARGRDGKTGPAWHKLPGSKLIRYSRADVLSWFAACREDVAAS